MAARGEPAASALVCGEVRTGLLQTSRALPARDVSALLRLRADERVLISERPHGYAVSPVVLTGIDCRLPTAGGARVRAVGTIAARAVVTEGRMLQATAFADVLGTGPDVRRPWGHYLAHPGVVEPAGKLPERAAADGLLTGAARPGELDLGAIAERLLARVARHRLLDQRAPFKSQRTRLRWVAVRSLDGEEPSIESFTLAEDGLRTVELRLPEGMRAEDAATLCEDLALHDWLLTTLVRMIERSRLGSADGPDAVLSLRPAVDHLLHLWMPTAHVDRSLAPLWEVLEREPGFTRQWQTMVQRVRDQLALHAITLRRDASTART